MYYVYRYLDANNNIFYVGITNDLLVRLKAHKRDDWYSDKLIYEFIEVDNKFIAKLFETYLINRDSPYYNIAENNGWDVSLINFSIEENWSVFKEETSDDKKREEKKHKDVRKIDSNRFKVDEKFKDLLLNNKDKITKIYYDQYEHLCVSSNSEELCNMETLPLYAIEFRVSKSYCKMTIKFNKEENLEEESQKILREIIEGLNIESMNLDKDYGKKEIIKKTRELEKQYDSLLENNYKIIFVSAKTNIEIPIDINKLFFSFGGVECAYNTGFALYLKFSNRDFDDGMLIYYEPIEWSNLQQYLKDEFKNHFYIKYNSYKDFRILRYLIAKNKIVCRLMSGYPEYDKEYGDYYISTQIALDVDID